MFKWGIIPAQQGEKYISILPKTTAYEHLHVSMRLSAVPYSSPAPRPGHKLGIISSHLLNRRGGDPGVTRMCQERGRGSQEPERSKQLPITAERVSPPPV